MGCLAALRNVLAERLRRIDPERLAAGASGPAGEGPILAFTPRLPPACARMMPDARPAPGRDPTCTARPVAVGARDPARQTE